MPKEPDDPVIHVESFEDLISLLPLPPCYKSPKSAKPASNNKILVDQNQKPPRVSPELKKYSQSKEKSLLQEISDLKLAVSTLKSEGDESAQTIKLLEAQCQEAVKNQKSLEEKYREILELYKKAKTTRSFEEENLRLCRLLEDEKAFTDQVIEGNKKIRAEVALLRRDLAVATRPLQPVKLHQWRLLAVAKKFVVKPWDEFHAQCDRLGEWWDELTRDQPMGWICACGVLGLIVVALVAELINMDQNYVLLKRYS